jgi:molecular chaperone GrpE (heat shock protein)
MSRLQQASDRLKAALERLETVAESAIAKQDQNDQNDGADAKEVEALREQLAAMRDDYDRLTRTTETVSARLDGAVDQLKLVLEDEPVKKQA